MRRVLVIILFSLFIQVPLFSDTKLPGNCNVFFPQILKSNPILKESVANTLTESSDYGQNDVNTNEFWVVFSDRDQNATFVEPSSSSGLFTTLKLGEKLRIAEIKNGFALVYSEPKPGLSFPIISEHAESKGWVPMDRLLLWKNCLANEKRILNKALIAYNLDDDGNKKSDLGYAFFNPEKTDLNNKKNYKELSTSMSFYFVMKRHGNYSLLASQSNMGEASNAVLLGWVSKDFFVPWSQRSCLEPNWDPEFVKAMKGEKIMVYPSPSLTGPSSPYTIGKNFQNGDEEDNERFRLPGSMLRFPILNTMETSFQCTNFATLNGEDISNIIINRDSLYQKRKTALEKMARVNLIIVIDGTHSMSNYYPIVQDAITKGFEAFDNNIKPKVGVVIYRDYEDGDCMIESLPLGRVDSPQLKSFLDLKNVGTHNYGCNSKAKSREEALYKGLEKALDARNMGYSPDESNLIMVVGDCGNHPEDEKAPSVTQLIQKMVANNVNLMAFQVIRIEEEPWLLFASQMEKILINNVQQQYNRIFSSKQKVKFKDAINANSYDLNFEDNVDRQFFVASFRSPLKGAMQPSDLTSMMEVNLMKFSKAIQDREDALVRNSTVKKPDISEETWKADSAWVCERLHLTPKEFNTLQMSNSLLAYTGYTSKLYKGMEAWKSVIFISSTEFLNLCQSLGKVNAKTTDRKVFYDAICALVRSMVPDITESEMNSMGTDQVTTLIGGLNATSNAMSYKLNEILDPDAMPLKKFSAYTNEFDRKTQALMAIKDDANYRFKDDFNGAIYYWIPVEMLP